MKDINFGFVINIEFALVIGIGIGYVEGELVILLPFTGITFSRRTP